MKGLLILAIAAAVGYASMLEEVFEEEWNNFKLAYGKSYQDSTEESFRRKIYLQNKRMIEKHNSRYNRGEVKFSMAMNEYGDMLHQELIGVRNGFKRTYGLSKARNGSAWVEPHNVCLPAQIDWREKGAVTPVKNQGQCGSCWSFSTTGSIEGQHFKKTGKLVSLSEQNLVDCSSSFGNQGCNGGLMDQAFEYVKENHGIDTELSYPYVGHEEPCHFRKRNSGATVTGYVDLPSGDERALQKAVATIGPISIAIDASHTSFQFYKHGVYDEPECDSQQLDHGVLVVGYGTENGQDYWLVKNSWGQSWGREGYVYMSRNKKNQCGVATQASYPLV